MLHVLLLTALWSFFTVLIRPKVCMLFYYTIRDSSYSLCWTGWASLAVQEIVN